MTTTNSLSERLIYTDLANNNNKFWHGEVKDNEVHLNWGRVGDTGQFKVTSFFTHDQAVRNFESTVKSKLRKGYTRQQTIKEGVQAIPLVASRDIKHDNDPETAALIKFLVKRNIHKIEGSTNIRFESGMLTTPLGPVTNDGLDEAEKLLVVMSRHDQDFADAVNQYLRIVPRSIGRSRIDPNTLFGTPQQIQVEQATIDSLRAVVKDIEDRIANESTTASPLVTRLEIVSSDYNDFSRISKYFNATINNRHVTSNMKLVRLWQMDIEIASKAFASNIGNIKELWHGTKDANLLSILKTGYVIPKRGTSIAITGRMFGDGIYFSDQSTKSLNYTSTFWGGQGSQRSFMLLNDVAMGKEFIPQRSGISSIPKGYDSCFAKANVSGVMNNEMIVYNTSQVKPKFLCEFGSK